VDPEQGTLGSAHWARWVVDGGLRHLIDPREIPADWSTGSLRLGTTEPGGEGGWSAGSEVYELNADLVDRALELTQGVDLADSDRAAESGPIRMGVVDAVRHNPIDRAAFKRERAAARQKVFNQLWRLITTMSQESVKANTNP
jgi:purine nucleoside permease